ncbi:MAG: hypothetical protein H6R18_2249 [Proteobacteria bacterium]|nr:hypothetical protein [Pseudomonadota bacterium]
MADARLAFPQKLSLSRPAATLSRQRAREDSRLMPIQAERFRFTDYYQGSRWFPGGVALLLILLFALWLLASLAEMQERSEKLMVELTIRNVRVGLKVAMVQAMAHGQEGEIRRWAGRNPLLWLGAIPEGNMDIAKAESNLTVIPDGYGGNCTPQEMRELAGGSWCFDPDSGELAYRPRNDRHLRSISSAEQSKVLRWKVVASGDGNLLQNPAFLGVNVQLLTPYIWFGD